MHTVSIVGARPQFVKLAPVSRAMTAFASSSGSTVLDTIVHTGQHYDASLSQVFFDELEIPKPDIDLGIGSGSHATQTAGMLQGIERVLIDTGPDIVIIYGDTNSTLAGAIAASKLNIAVAHVEAGLRSFDRSMPEEVNRIVADQLSDLLLAPTDTAMHNLETENLHDRAVQCGDVMLDAARFNLQLSKQKSTVLQTLNLERGKYAVATIHRAANTDSNRLQTILESLNEVAESRIPVVFPMHPRTSASIKRHCPDWTPGSGLLVTEPVGYLDMLSLVDAATVVLTDSGGLQKESFFLGTRCITLREVTEWPETVTGNGNTLVGIDRKRLLEAIDGTTPEMAAKDRSPIRNAEHYFGQGDAAHRIVASIVEFLA